MQHIRSSSVRWLASVSLLTGACAVADLGPPHESEAESALGAGDVRWVPSALNGVAQIQMTHNHDGSLAAFARTTGGGIVFDKQVIPGGDWLAPVSLGGWGLKDFAVAEQADGRLVLFALGGDGAIYAQTQTATNAASFSGWAYLGGHDLQDVAAARQADGRLVMLAVGADHNVYEQLQSTVNGGFAPWSWVGGPGVLEIAMAAQPSGRLALVGRTPDGEIMFSSQSSPNANFVGWTTLDGWQLRGFSLARNSDGRLELVAIGGDYNVYDKPQATPDLGWDNWYAVGAGGVTNLTTALAADGSLNIFMISGDQQIHRLAQNGPGAGLIWEPSMGGNHLVQVTADHDADGRLELMGLGADGVVYQTWQTAPNSGWLALPAAPNITYTSASANPAQVGSTVTVYWDTQTPSGCSSYVHVDIQSPLQGHKQIGSWSGSNGANASFTIQDDTAVTVTAGCYEGLSSGVPLENKRGMTIRAVQPTNVTYQQYLAEEVPYDGAIPYGYVFGTGINGGKLISLQNPNLYSMSLIGPSAKNTDCWGASAVTLSPQQTTTAANITKLFGSATPALPLHIRACLSQAISGYAPINITYTYPH